jgi:hypothetical protein
MIDKVYLRNSSEGDSRKMDSETDEMFYPRADAHIDLANKQLADASRGKVSASFMYAVARFNSWVTACRADSAEDLRAGKEESIEYFVSQYRAMLSENLEDYVEHFDKYMRPDGNNA